MARAALEQTYEVCQTSDGAEGLVAFEKMSPQLVITDVKMSVMDGFTACQRIRETPSGRHTPILMLTGLDDFESIERAFEVGATDFAVKPVNWLVLAHRVENMLRSSRTVEKLRRSETRLSQAQRIARLGSWKWDPRTNELTVSSQMQEILGLEPQVRTLPFDDFIERVEADDREVAHATLAEVLDQRASKEIEFRVVTPNGAERSVVQHAEVVADPDDAGICVHGTVQDITERKQAEERIRFLAYYDGLTGLPNRRSILQRLDAAFAESARDRVGTMAVLFLDLDRFKRIDDTLGHMAGDELLRQVSMRMLESVRGNDIVCRPTGGDDDSRGIVSRFGGDGYQFYSEAMNSNSLEQVLLEGDLNQAIDRAELKLFYQPLVDAATGDMLGAEALIRWQHPSLGLLTPDRFIPLAEKSDNIVRIGEWVLRTACSEAYDWQKKVGRPMRIAVNISIRQLLDPGMVDSVVVALMDSGLDAELLELELTESIFLEDRPETRQCLEALKTLGIRMSLDDFGTGYSSLSYLIRFPVDVLKIDRTFLAGVPDETEHAALTRAIIAMARSLQIEVVAEGVETSAAAAFLRDEGCEALQGFLFGRPMSIEDFGTRLQEEGIRSLRKLKAVG